MTEYICPSQKELEKKIEEGCKHPQETILLGIKNNQIHCICQMCDKRWYV